MSLFRNLCLAGISAFCMLSFASGARAATLEDHTDSYMGCRARLSGVIGPGDADKIKAWIATEKQRLLDRTSTLPPGSQLGQSRLCLDSPGGSFAEAVRIVDVIFGELGTAVPRGAECLSACSMVFMAGSFSTESDAGVVANRKLHAAGRLGFHAPSLEVAAGQYSEAQVNKAYRIAVTALGDLMQRMGVMKLSQTLIAEMLATPPDDMFYIDTVHRAGRWLIPVVGTVRPQEVTALAASNVCGAYYGWVGDRLATNGLGFVADPANRFGWDPKITHENDSIQVEMEGFGQEGAMRCRLWISPDTAIADELQSFGGGFAHVSIGDDDIGFEASPALFFDPRTPLVALARPNDDQIILRDVADFNPTERREMQGRCSVWSSGQMLDNDPCTKQVAETMMDDLKLYVLETFVWPSGAKTVLETLNFATKINGAKAERMWNNLPDNAVCYLNSASGNMFCFQEAG